MCVNIFLHIYLARYAPCQCQAKHRPPECQSPPKNLSTGCWSAPGRGRGGEGCEFGKGPQKVHLSNNMPSVMSVSSLHCQLYFFNSWQLFCISKTTCVEATGKELTKRYSEWSSRPAKLAIICGRHISTLQKATHFWHKTEKTHHAC